MKKILSIDGGGIRGIIPAILLTEIEKRTNRPISRLFDLIAGTSTGGIIALGLSKPGHEDRPEYTAQDIVELYERHGMKIFQESQWRKIKTLGYLLEEKYEAARFDRILGHYFKQAYLKEALTNVLVTSYEIERRHAFFFKSWNAKKHKLRNFLMRDVARATSAAPTYFEPKKIPTEDLQEYFALIDGGVFANNPAMCAYIDAQILYPEEKEFMVVSLGTGEVTRPIFYDQSRHWGKYQWAQPILNVVFSGVNDTVDYQLRQLLPMDNNLRRYYRFQVRLDESSDDLDKTDPINIRALKLHAENLIREQSDTVDMLCAQLAPHEEK